MSKTSEFGKGLTYCLGLFLCHEAQNQRDELMIQDLKDKNKDIFSFLKDRSMWFSGATDHLYDIQIESCPIKVRKRLQKFNDKCFSFRGLGAKSTSKDVEWALEEAKTLLYLIDKANNVPVAKADYS